MTRRDIEHLRRTARIQRQQIGHGLRRRKHQRAHAPREAYPYGMLRCDGAELGVSGSAFAHGQGEIVERAGKLRSEHELRGAASISW